MPTQIGYDSDHPLARGEVGRVGVAVDSLRDFEIIYEAFTRDMDLDKIYKSAIKGTMESKELKSTRQKRWEERFQLFIFLALIFLSFEFFIREKK